LIKNILLLLPREKCKIEKDMGGLRREMGRYVREMGGLVRQMGAKLETRLTHMWLI
jgi:hypothetical protein